jgi:hypothetical protein
MKRFAAGCHPLAYTTLGVSNMAKAKQEEVKFNKMKAVAEALDALGGDPGPKELMEQIKETHGVDLKYPLVASYKSQIIKKRGGGRAATRSSSLTGTMDIKDIQVIRDLLNRLGEPKLQSFIRALR